MVKLQGNSSYLKVGNPRTNSSYELGQNPNPRTGNSEGKESDEDKTTMKEHVSVGEGAAEASARRLGAGRMQRGEPAAPSAAASGRKRRERKGREKWRERQVRGGGRRRRASAAAAARTRLAPSLLSTSGERARASEERERGGGEKKNREAEVGAIVYI